MSEEDEPHDGLPGNVIPLPRKVGILPRIEHVQATWDRINLKELVDKLPAEKVNVLLLLARKMAQGEKG
ncbi:hypothetical protein [Roseomonas sp. WA12]